jgi:hypothetical protein
MFVPKQVLKQDGGHRIERTCKNSENTEIPCTEIRLSIQSILHYIELVGVDSETWCNFCRCFKYIIFLWKHMSCLTENAQWIMSTEGVMMFACKCGGTIWLKARLTKYTGKGHYPSFRMIDEVISRSGWN